jgi:mannose-6-phosphate isomerase-like protein (cupin superfamily)
VTQSTERAREQRKLLPFLPDFIHEHFHPQEEVYEVIDGELELTIDGVKQVVRPGLVGIVPSKCPPFGQSTYRWSRH